MQEGETVLIEDPEKFVPFDWFEILVRLAEIDPQDATFALGPYSGRPPFARLDPFADFVMVGGCVGFGHAGLLAHAPRQVTRRGCIELAPNWLFRHLFR